MNSLLIKGFQKTSLVDYPGKVAAVVFVGKCNFRCPYCHNRDLVLDYDSLPTIKEKEVLEHLLAKKKWIDGVCISGGEPLLYKELSEFARKVKKAGFLVKIDTNGTNPSLLGEMIKEKVVDYIAMDIKGPLDRYEFVTRSKVNLADIKKSVELIRKSGIRYELRMTVVPGLHERKDFTKIGKWLKGARLFAIQQFRPRNCIDKSFERIEPFSLGEIEKFKKVMERYVKRLR